MELDDVFDLLETARLLEKNGQRIEAATKYYESCYLMRQIISRFPQNDQNEQPSSSICSLLENKIEFYTLAAQKLYFDDSSVNVKPTSKSTPATLSTTHTNRSSHGIDDSSVLALPAMTLPESPRSSMLTNDSKSDRFIQSAEINKKASLANASLGKAIDLDEDNQTQAAIKSYLSAAEMYLNAIQLAETSRSLSIAPVMKRRLASALDRVETLKSPARPQPNQQRQPKIGSSHSDESAQVSSRLSKEEISVLKQSSLIASGLFLPFSEDEAQLLSRQVTAQNSYKNKTSKSWRDPDGDLPLSEKQKKTFHRWARPCEIVQQRSRSGVKQHPPVMISNISPYTIKQQYVTDCSFIASLCICALFEKQFRKRLITSIIYPQDKNGIPIYNPSGKYMVKLWLNGVARSVIVDDRLPVDRHSNLLCSQTTGNRSQLELFCSIIEKAYIKLSGGYDFPGSNSGVDLFSLTGWIPERIFFPSKHSTGKIRDFETPPDRAWDRLYSANSFGDCLITVSTTRDMTEEKAKSLGLVTGHAYAVLDVFQSQNGTKLLQLKNPWACKGWTGKYSPYDKFGWRDNALQRELGYDPIEAAKHDDGIFWISWSDLLLYFRNLQLSWNPKLFSYRFTTHGSWPMDQGPKFDTFNVGQNPQYIMVLSDKAVSSKPTIWVLISRHVSKQEQEGAEVNDYLTIHLLRNSSKLERVWYPHGKDTIVNGCYTNNPHVLLRYDILGPEDKYISLVLSQHEKTQDLAYTLSCYCTEAFTLTKPPKMLPSSCDVRNKWNTHSAGGPVGSRGFFTNPMFAITILEKSEMQIRCSTVKAIAGKST
jgi:calpain-7